MRCYVGGRHFAFKRGNGMVTEIAVHVRITGRVQGVWYRGWTVQEACKRGLSGWIRNRRDGTVEAVFAGDAVGVSEMCELCHTGPPMAAVVSVEIEPTATPDSSLFEARPTV